VPSFDPRRNQQAVQLVLTKGKNGPGFTYFNVVETIYESYLSAIKVANKYVYIEDQYFREPDLTKALISRMKEVPDLRVIILVPNQAEDEANMKEDEAKELARFADLVQHEQIEALRKFDKAHERVELFSLSRGRRHEMYVHAKLMIVDDLWFTIGSANTNPRSFHLDGESNVLVRDEAAARALRLKLWSEHFGAGRNNSRLAKQFDIAAAKRFLLLWRAEAGKNDADLRNGHPLTSFIVTHVSLPGASLNGVKYLLQPAVRQLVTNEPPVQQSPFDEVRFVEVENDRMA
jgi:phosphatidylserine/phosphatidylglycerophosphate/cardiolipin synthase-like enzyme